MNLSVFSKIIEIKDKVKDIGEPESCIYTHPYFKINESDFFLDIKNIARYRVQNGQQVMICPYENTDQKSVDLFLEGAVLGAILHQKRMLPFHGSSFAYRGKGIVICGHSGVGKSSVTAAFCQQEATFINDDITPVSDFDSKTKIIPLKTRIKLWEDSLRKLEIGSDHLQRIRSGIEKFYLPMNKRFDSEHTLNHVFILSTHQKNEFQATELKGMEKYNALRRQVYRRIYLKGMPGTEKKYFRQMFSLAANIRVTGIIRPDSCEIHETMHFIENEMDL